MKATAVRPLPEQESARAALRSAIHAEHEALHQVPLLRRLADGSITRVEYLEVLQRLHRFHATIEARLAAGPSLAGYGIDLAGRCRAPLLVADLRHFGQDVRKNDADGLGAPGIPAARPAALGMLYITEGATLGGRVLARSLDHLLGRGEAGRRFLLGHAERHAALWQALCLAVEACGGDAEDRMAMIVSARAAIGWMATIMAPVA